MNVPRPKKVLLLITKSNWGGAQRYVFDLATALPADQFKVAVALGGNGTLREKLLEAGIRVIDIPGLQRDVSLKQELTASTAIYKILRRERPDVLHLNSSKAGAVGALLGRIAHVPHIVFTAHGWAFNEDRPRWQQLIIKGLHWITVILSHRTIAVSQAIREQLGWPWAQQKMVVVHNGRTIGSFANQDTARSDLIETCPALAPYRADVWTGTIAELHPIKRHDVAIAAIKQLTSNGHRVRHLIIGDGELNKSLKDQVAALGLTEHVFFLGHVHEAARLLKALDIFMLTSRSEALAYTVVEAAQAGLPIVASAVGGLPEIITSPAEGVLVPTGDSTALAQELEALIRNPERRAEIATGAAARGRYFTLQRMVQETIEAYDRSDTSSTIISRVV